MHDRVDRSASTAGLGASIASLRRMTVAALLETVAELPGSQLSEREIRDRWRHGLERYPRLLPEGWYVPPPHGIGVLVGSPHDRYARNGVSSLRPVPAWPSSRRRMNREALLTVYASPIDRETGLIGDVMATLYWGDDTALRRHIHDVRQTVQAMAEEAVVGIRYRDFYHIATRIIDDRGMRNTIVGISDPTGTNIGHTIPWSAEAMSLVEREVLRSGDPQAIAAQISAKRKFINSTETSTIPANGAFTVEPRLQADGQPTAAYHVVVAFDQGRKRLICELEPLLEASNQIE